MAASSLSSAYRSFHAGSVEFYAAALSGGRGKERGHRRKDEPALARSEHMFGAHGTSIRLFRVQCFTTVSVMADGYSREW
jgi:hypothetical protein